MAKREPGPVTEQELEAAATLLLNHMQAIDPTWCEYINIGRAELHRSEFQFAAGMMATTLDNSMHMSMPNRPEFQPGYTPRGAQAPCERCGEMFKVQWPGQKYCGNACADAVTGNATSTSHSGDVATGYDEV